MLLLLLVSKILKIILIFKLHLHLLMAITHQEEAYKIKILVIKKEMFKIREFYNRQIRQVLSQIRQIRQMGQTNYLLKG